MHATKTLELELKKSFDVVLLPGCSGSIFAGGGHFELPHARSSSGRGGAQRTRQGPGHSRGVVHTNWHWQKRSRKINLKFLAGGFPALTVENRFQALPETSNRRFSLAEMSGTGLICDWQNF